MTYCMVRLYSGTTADQDERILAAAKADLIPKLGAVEGLLRYSYLRIKDGRAGSFSLFENKTAADEGAKIAIAWPKTQEALANIKLTLSLEGEIGLTITGDTPPQPGKEYALARLYTAAAPFDQVNAAIEKEGRPQLNAIPGLIRYMTAKFTDGRIGGMSVYSTPESARAMADKARELRKTSGSQLSKLLPNDPEIIEGQVLYSYIPTR